MLEIIALLCLPGALILLAFLSAIDLKEGLLPNELVLGFAALGMVFHLSTVFAWLDLQQMALGALAGGGSLLLIRQAALLIYKQDALGLGDVKLMMAAGVWLGPEMTMIALASGAFAGFLHGLGAALYIKSKRKHAVSLKELSIPAGPGFAIGIVLAAVLKFHDISLLIENILP